MSLTFWETHRRAYGVNCATVDYPVTTQTPQGAFTTVIAFYVCKDIGLDKITQSIALLRQVCFLSSSRLLCPDEGTPSCSSFHMHIISYS